MARIPLTPNQEELKHEFQLLRERFNEAVKHGYLPEDVEQMLPPRINDEFIREMEDVYSPSDIREMRGKLLRNEKTQENYRDRVTREEIIEDFISQIEDALDRALTGEAIGHPIRESSQQQLANNVGALRAILHAAIQHYGQDSVNQFLADDNNMEEINDIIEKIAVNYARAEQAEADALIVEFAQMFNGGPLDYYQMEDLEESGAFDFYEDDLL